MRIRRVRAALLAVLAVSIGAGAWSLWPAPEHRLIYAESLSDGRVFQCFSDGSAMGPAGNTVEVRHTKGLPGAGGTEMVVSSPGFTEDEMRRAAENYRKSGRTPEGDEADFDRLSAECERRH